MRSRFTDLIGQGEDPQAASAAVINEFCFGPLEDFDNNRIILALARVEHDLGIADPHITEYAFRIIDGEDPTEWGDEAGRRKTALQGLRRKLLEDLPPRKVVRPRKFNDKSIEVGQHFLYTEESSGSKLVLRVVGNYSDANGRYPRFTVLEWDGNSDDLQHAHLLAPVRQDHPRSPDQVYIGAFIVGGRVKKANFVELPTTARVESVVGYGAHFMGWSGLVGHVRIWAITTPSTITQPAEE